MGQRGALPSADRLLSDLAEVVDESRFRMNENTPLILLGHSMGGLVAGRFVSLGMRKVQALVLSSPGTGPWPECAAEADAGGGCRGLRRTCVSANGLNADFISHDPAVVAAYRADPLVHDRISARLAVFHRRERAGHDCCCARLVGAGRC